MSDTVALLRADITTQITAQTDEEAITPEIDGALRDRMALLVDERLFRGGESRGATIITGTKDANAYGIITNNLRRMTVTSAGRVLIKTETESTFDLDVAGTGRFTGNLNAGAVLLSGQQSAMLKRSHNSLAGTHIGAVESGGAGWDVYFYPDSGGYYAVVTQTGVYINDTARTTAIGNFKNAKALLHASSTTKGALICRMTGAQAEAIAPGATEDMMLVSITNGNGAVINSRGFWYWDNTGATWVKL